MKKKYLVWFFLSDNINQPLATHSFLINKLAENFEKIFLINLKNLNIILEDNEKNITQFIDKIDDKFDIKNNVEIFNPISKNDFESFVFEKELNAIIINNFGTNLPSIKLLRYLKKFKIIFFEINDISNIQIKQKLELRFLIKGIKFKLKKIYYILQFFLLSNFNLISKYEILFCSNLKKIENSKKKFLNFKKIVKINSKAFDILNSEKPKIKEDKIVLLDDHFGHPTSLAMRGELNEADIKLHYQYLNTFLNILSKEYNKEIVICIHPKDDLELKQKLFSNYKVLKYQTREKIIESFIVIFFESTAIIDAILFKKNIITVFSKFMDKSVRNASNQFKDNFKLPQIELSENIQIDKSQLLNEFNHSKIKFESFISNYIQIDGDNFGYKKIINNLKKFF
tara:strand:+ start:6853 stop:8046 length:1194 start_codon:yes stop_codon:yes gene_type:complete